MKITLIAVGKIKEKFFAQAIAEYEKRLSRYCSLQIVELSDEKAPETLSDAQMQDVLWREGQRILEKIPSGSVLITLDVEGRSFSSEEFAAFLEKNALEGNSHLTFVVGGSLGLHRDVKKRADLSLSFSAMTFPHQLFRVLLLEQIYRGFRILRNEPYHK